MASRGYAALSMRDLARALRISTGTLYHYFPSKVGIFEAILHRYGVRELNKRASQTPTQSFEEGVERIINNCREQEVLWAKIMFIQVDAYREPDGKMLSTFNNVFTSPAAGKQMMQTLHIDDVDVVNQIRALILGIIIQRALSKRDIDWDVQKRLMIDTYSKFARRAD